MFGVASLWLEMVVRAHNVTARAPACACSLNTAIELQIQPRRRLQARSTRYPLRRTTSDISAASTTQRDTMWDDEDNNPYGSFARHGSNSSDVPGLASPAARKDLTMHPAYIYCRRLM